MKIPEGEAIDLDTDIVTLGSVVEVEVDVLLDELAGVVLTANILPCMHSLM